MATTEEGKSLIHWQDWLNLALAVWLFVSPWLLGFHGTTMLAAWNAWVFGLAIAVFAIAALVQFAIWEEWVNVVVGVWLIVSPWVLQFSHMAYPAANMVIVGLLVVAFAAWELREAQVHLHA